MQLKSPRMKLIPDIIPITSISIGNECALSCPGFLCFFFLKNKITLHKINSDFPGSSMPLYSFKCEDALSRLARSVH